MKTVYIVEDEPLLCELLGEFLRETGLLRIIGQSQNGAVACKDILRLKPDIVVSDLLLPGMGGLDLLDRVKAALPSTKVLIFSGVATADQIQTIVKKDVDGFVEKTAGLEEFVKAIEVIVGGRSYFSASVLPMVRRMSK